MQAAEKPESEKNEQYQAQSASEPRSTIPAIPIIATAAPEQQDDHDNDQNCAHLLTPLAERAIAPRRPYGASAADV
jgi:hypothetical protein